MSFVRRSCAAAIIFAAMLLTPPSSPLAAADLEMVDAFGNVVGVIDVSNRGLSVFENSGAQFFYQRAPQYDLPGGRYLGFYSRELNRIIRFPRSGRGPVERADLNTPLPRFVSATVTVRPIGSGPGFSPYLSQWLNQPTTIGPSVGSPQFGSGAYGAIPAGPYGGSYQPYRAGSGLTQSQPRSVLLDSSRINNTNLPPVQIEFFNSSGEPIVVTLTDALNPGKEPQYRLKPGQRQRVMLPRDAGQTRVDLYQTTDVTGLPIEQEVRVNVPPAPRYEITVHRIRIQSIAIDRTGKSPHPIEDINVQGIGVGRFQLPPGDQLSPGVIDAYRAAKAAVNQGLVAPIPFNE